MLPSGHPILAALLCVSLRIWFLLSKAHMFAKYLLKP